MRTRRRWLEWRYAAAGLGWGVAVGAATGLLLGVLVTIGLLWDERGRIGLFEGVGLVVGVPVWGLLLGGFLGAVAGIPGGLLNAVVQPHVRGHRAAWWSSWAIATLTAGAVIGMVAGTQTTRGAVDPGASWVPGVDAWTGALALLPGLVGGWLTARTGRGLRERRRREASAVPGQVLAPPGT